MLYRRAGDHKTVVIVVFERIEVFVELDEMIGGNVRGLMRGGLHEVDFDCSGDLEIRRSSCVSVSIFLGIKFRITSLSGRTR